MKTLEYLRFASQLAGPVSDLLKALFVRHKGDVRAARTELLRRIPDHGAELDIVEAEVEAQMRRAVDKPKGDA